MVVVEVYVFDVVVVVGGDGEVGFVCVEYVDVVDVEIYDVVDCFGIDLE